MPACGRLVWQCTLLSVSAAAHLDAAPVPPTLVRREAVGKHGLLRRMGFAGRVDVEEGLAPVTSGDDWSAPTDSQVPTLGRTPAEAPAGSATLSLLTDPAAMLSEIQRLRAENIALRKESDENKDDAMHGRVDPAEEWSRLSGLLYVAPFLIICVIIFEVFHKRYSDIDWSLPVAYPDELSHMSLASYFGDAWSWISEYILSPSDCLKRNFMVCYLFVNMLGDAYINMSWTLWTGRWYGLLQFPKENKEAFSPLFANFVILVCVDIVKGVYVNYVMSWFMLDWKTWMTRRFQKLWLSDRTFYLLELADKRDEFDNPDQRIAEDAVSFCDASWSLFAGFLTSLLDLFIYVPMLWRLSPTSVFGYFDCKGWLLYMALGWAIFGTILVHFVGRVLIALKYGTQRYNADYRFSLVNIRHNSESIAMLGAEAVEGERLTGEWHRIRRITWEWMFFNKRYDFCMAACNHAGRLLGLVVLVPAYINGEILLGDMRMAHDALSSVKSDFEFFVNSYGAITDWRAAVARLKCLEAKALKSLELDCRPLEHSPERVAGDPTFGDDGSMGEGLTDAAVVAPPVPRASAEHGDQEDLVVRGLRVLLPSGRLLVEAPTEFLVKPGDRVLLTGPVGSGKSTLLRALSGIWPHSVFAENGCLRLPPRDRCLFLPRVPALSAGSLRDAVTYPEQPGTYADEELANALRSAGLGDFLANSPTDDAGASSSSRARVAEAGAVGGEGLAREADWDKVLSGGEKQRLLAAHVIVKKPALLFLDEATSSMSREAATALYQEVIKAIGPKGALITISHDVEGMKPLHNLFFRVDGATKSLVSG